MPAPSNSVDICNLALDVLGQKPIASITNPQTETESVIARWYDQSREAVLQSHVWNFAKTEATIARSGTPGGDFDDMYLLPTDCLRVLSVGGETELDQETAFDIRGRHILVDNGGSNSLYIRYIRNEVDVVKFPALFIEALSLKLAMNTATRFTLKQSWVDKIQARFTEVMALAESVDGQERPPLRVSRSYVSSRRMGYTGPRSVGDNRYYH